MTACKDFCPFVGIEPFAETDREYFFGRGREQRIITSNLYAAPLTILYGASGVGKTSVLLAGVVPRLRAATRTAVVVFRDWQDDAFVDLLKKECAAAIELAQKAPLEIDVTLAFDEFLLSAEQIFNGTILIILDQFEEYFLYHPAAGQQVPFEAQFARIINREDMDVNFLLAMREDGLARLDRFKTRIPTLLSNLLPLHHMDMEAAKSAICKPIDVYNKNFMDTPSVSIEDRLVTTLLDQVRTGRVKVRAREGSGTAKGDNKYNRIEAPFLQLVATRLWKKECRSHSRVLRLATLKQLGGARKIVRTHLDDLMKKLQKKERLLCSRIFDRLVTPSGSKIAIKDKDLAEYAGDLKNKLPSVLQKLAAPEARTLRRLPVPGKPDEQRYEIYHDVLASAILEWQGRFIHRLKYTARRRQRNMRIGLAAATLFAILAILIFRYYAVWLETRPWGMLTNLTTGSVHLLRGETITVGRNARNLEFKKTVSLLPNDVSRIHFLLSRDLKAIDMRSLVGTTINHRFLAYGETMKLKHNDFIVIADIAPFQFKEISYGKYQFWEHPTINNPSPPPQAWGIFLDLVSHEMTYLTKNRYFMSEEDAANLSLSTHETNDWTCLLGLDKNYIAIWDRKDGIDLSAEIKTGATYTYRSGIVPAETVHTSFNWKKLKWSRTRGRDDEEKEKERNELSIFRSVFHTSTGRHFRIILIIKNLEPETTHN